MDGDPVEKIKHLGDGELEIMMAVWGAEKPVASPYIQEKLKGSRDWALPAVITALNRLIDKGFLASEKRGRVKYYRPLISEGDYKAAESRGLLDRLYGGSFKGLTASLVEGKAIGKAELDDLRRFLDELEGK